MKTEETVLALKAEYFRDKLNNNSILRVKVNGNSMWPLIRNGNIVVVRKVNFREIRVGDIVFTNVGSNILCHRVFGRRGDFIVTKADTFIGFDPPVTKEALIGKVVAKEKNGRVYTLNGLLSYRAGFIISRVSIIASFCYLPLRFIKRLVSRFSLSSRDISL